MENDILKELKEQTKWLRLLAFSNLKNVIEENLSTKALKRLYSLSDGKNSSHKIERILTIEGYRLSHVTVLNYWKKWNALGIVAQSEKYKGRFKKIIELQDLDIKVE